MLPIHIVTVAHQSMPFIRHHLGVFMKLNRPWTWRICEGVTSIPAWFNMPGKITDDMHENGLSTDGTSEYLQDISHLYPNKIKLFRDDEYLTDKFQLMLSTINDTESIVCQIDVDEFWSSDQLETMASMFESQPTRTAAWFYDRFFVGPRLCLARGNGNSAGNMAYEWKRSWRWRPECKYVRHDPPQVSIPHCPDIAMSPAHFFTREETAAAGLVFNHYAYVLEEQVRYKETRYGFKGAVDGWNRLQQVKNFPVDLYDYIPNLGHGLVELAPEEFWWQ